MNHTKGPWVVGPLNVIWSQRPEYVIADVRQPRDKKNDSYNPKSSEECVANAYLIAAAPDIYEALKAVHRLLDGGMFPDAIHLSGEEADAIRAALAKAEGK